MSEAAIEDEELTLGEVLRAHRVEQLGFPGHVKCHACDDWTEGTIADHHADLARAHLATTALRAAIDAAHEEQRRGLNEGRSEETMTLFQHWSAAAGWLASRIRAIERGEDPDWPDAMVAAPAPDDAEGRA